MDPEWPGGTMRIRSKSVQICNIVLCTNLQKNARSALIEFQYTFCCLRFRTRSSWLRTCWTRWTRWSSGAGWPSPSGRSSTTCRYTHNPLLRSVTTTPSLCVYFGTHFFVVSCHFCIGRRPGVSTFGKVRGKWTHLLYILESMPLLQIVATLVTHLPVGEVVVLL